MAKYDVYDETEKESLYLKFFEGKKNMSFEVGGTFYLNWSQGLTDTKYIRAMRDELAGMGIKGLRIERME